VWAIVQNGMSEQHTARPGDAVRRVIVRDRRAHDGVCVVFGERITAYDWMYLVAALGGTASADILALVADLDRRERGSVHTLFTSAAA
jgi:hypothetical protein